MKNQKPIMKETPSITNHTDTMFALRLDGPGGGLRVDHKTTETVVGDDGTEVPAILLTSRGVTRSGGEEREWRIQRTIALNPNIRIPPEALVREAKAQNSAELWRIAFAS